MTLSLIVAVSENQVIGRDGELPWHLRADLQRFKAITMGHHILMGRATYDSIGRLLPGRTTVILSRQASYSVDGARVAGSLDEALELSQGDDEVFVVGGQSLYQSALPRADRIYLTRVLADVPGDVVFPVLDHSLWQLTESESHPADDENDHAFRFEIYQRHQDERVRCRQR